MPIPFFAAYSPAEGDGFSPSSLLSLSAPAELHTLSMNTSFLITHLLIIVKKFLYWKPYELYLIRYGLRGNGVMKKMRMFVVLTVVVIIGVGICVFGQQQGQKGDEEGEFYGGEWPSDVPKTVPVKYYLPFPAGKSYPRMPTPGHNSPTNKYAIDFSMPIGTPVCASADGIVVKIVESGPDTGGQQNSLIIQHADGSFTMYLHLRHKGVVPKLGDFVFQGDIVAYSGASGTGVPHLHFSVNKGQTLESVPIEFEESKSQNKNVSQNQSFAEKYAKQISEYRKIEMGLVWGVKFGLWDEALAAKKSADENKPKDSDDVRLKRLYKKIEEVLKGFDGAVEDYIKKMKDAYEKKEYLRALEMAHFGSNDFKGTDKEEVFKAVLEELKKLSEYPELEKKLKESESRRSALKRIYKDDVKGGKTSSVIKDYQNFLKRYKDEIESGAVSERLEVLKSEETSQK